MEITSINKFYESSPFESINEHIPFVNAIFRDFLTPEEERQICQQFQKSCQLNKQVLWSGVQRQLAQDWADRRGLVTLISAMGPLKDSLHPQCLKRDKSSAGWSKYIKGASAVFAWYILRGEKVIILCSPPPERFHPSGGTTYQLIAEPTIKLVKRDVTKLLLKAVHPTVREAEDYEYQMWPVDDQHIWRRLYGMQAMPRPHCRQVKRTP